MLPIVARTAAGVAIAGTCLLVPAVPHAQAPPDALLQRVGAFVAGFVTGFSNVVAAEVLEIRRLERAVQSEFMLVVFPGATRDFLVFRDVIAVGGAPLDGRNQRLVELFLQPPDDVFHRAREISLAGEAHVPTVLNPLLAMSFLQAGYQPRFRFTVKVAGNPWQERVRAVTFTETGKPTLLRTGLFQHLDVPTRGTAWVEEATGRVLETELQMRFGPDIVTVTTSFRHDPRLDATVPDEMRTKNPDSRATYSDFRRFAVRVDDVVAVPTLKD